MSSPKIKVKATVKGPAATKPVRITVTPVKKAKRREVY